MESHDRGFLQWGQSKLILIFSSALLSLYSGVPKSYLTHLCVCVCVYEIYIWKKIYMETLICLTFVVGSLL